MPNNEDLQLIIKTLPGLEQVLAREVKKLGGRHVKEVKRGVETVGDMGFVYKANLWLRTALRVLVKLRNGPIRDEKALYKLSRQIPWEKHFPVNQTIVVDATVHSRKFTNSLYLSQITKDGIADRFREKTGKRPSVHTQNPDVRINLHVKEDKATLSLDSSRDSLHKRNYRLKTDEAPLNEVLAAGILQLSGWDQKSHLIDPMCGSGTFLTEAALMAHNIPPNVFRKKFGFQNWKNYDQDLFQLVFDKSLEKETPFNGELHGVELQPRSLQKARQNIRRALMEEQVQLHLDDFTAPEKRDQMPDTATLIFNPPYGQKMEADIPVLYEAIGDSLKQNFSGCTAWIFSASEEGLKHVGLKPSQKIELMNATLESWLVRYDLYEGSKKGA